MRVELEKLLSCGEEYENINIIIWGTGNTASLYQEGFERLKKEGFCIYAYSDNNKEKWHTQINGIEVIEPKKINDINNALVLICSPQPDVIKAVGKQLDEMNVRWKRIDEFILQTHKEDVLMCFDLLNDERSKSVYAEIIKCHLQGRYPEWEYVDKNQYFSFGTFSDYDPDEIFVDCGAFVGDSLEKYIWMKDGVFKKIYAFEPDKENIEAMKCRVQRLNSEWNLSANKIEIFPCGVGECSKKTYISRYNDNNGFGSKILKNEMPNTDECKMVSLDDVLVDGCSFLKADIESYEYKMLLGAKKTIENYQPKMAICIYHNSVDLYSIILLIKSICGNYKFAVRHYTHLLSDTVVYAYM